MAPLDETQAEEKMREAQSVYELFEEADTDGNGTISKEEFLNFGSNIGVPTKEEALELFVQVDTDKNGELPFEESDWLVDRSMGDDERDLFIGFSLVEALFFLERYFGPTRPKTLFSLPLVL